MLVERDLHLGPAAIRDAARLPLRDGRIADAELARDRRDGASGRVERGGDVHTALLGGQTAQRKGKLSVPVGPHAGMPLKLSEGGGMAKQRDLNDREKTVLQRIATKLAERGWSWSELARRVGKTASSASQWSGKRSFPRENVLYMIARELEVDMGWLLTGDEPTERRLAQTEAEMRMLELLRQLPPDQQRLAIGAVDGIKASLTKK